MRNHSNLNNYPQKIHQTHGPLDEQHVLYFKNAHQKYEHYAAIQWFFSNQKEKLITRFKTHQRTKSKKQQEHMSGRSSHAQTIDFTEIEN